MGIENQSLGDFEKEQALKELKGRFNDTRYIAGVNPKEFILLTNEWIERGVITKEAVNEEFKKDILESLREKAKSTEITRGFISPKDFIDFAKNWEDIGISQIEALAVVKDIIEEQIKAKYKMYARDGVKLKKEWEDLGMVF